MLEWALKATNAQSPLNNNLIQIKTETFPSMYCLSLFNKANVFE